MPDRVDARRADSEGFFGPVGKQVQWATFYGLEWRNAPIMGPTTRSSPATIRQDITEFRMSSTPLTIGPGVGAHTPRGWGHSSRG